MNFPNIEYSAGWYAANYPGFLNEQQYYILANWNKGVRNEEDIPQEEWDEYYKIRNIDTVTKANNDKKRKLEDCEEIGVEETKENGVHNSI